MTGSQTSLSGDLTPTEEQLVQTVLAGRRIDLKGETIRASMLRTLVTEVRSDWALPPIGLLLDNAVIQGTLDLEGCAVSKPLVFQHCKFRPIETARGALQLRDARLKRLAFYDALSPVRSSRTDRTSKARCSSVLRQSTADSAYAAQRSARLSPWTGCGSIILEISQFWLTVCISAVRGFAHG